LLVSLLLAGIGGTSFGMSRALAAEQKAECHFCLCGWHLFLPFRVILWVAPILCLFYVL
jgi:hypothetical protein